VRVPAASFSLGANALLGQRPLAITRPNWNLKTLACTPHGRVTSAGDLAFPARDGPDHCPQGKGGQHFDTQVMRSIDDI
jgi:hypothetical protein